MDAVLRLASTEPFPRGYGGLAVRPQNDADSFLCVVDNEEEFQVELTEKGAR
ncbi:MAG: hypothetical protein OXK78_18640 [Caldilineaceae bacterium]|nr:hypothetical protein [Caldilineaceae bacterium]